MTRLFSILTYLSIWSVVFSSYFKKDGIYNDAFYVWELIFSSLFLIEYIYRWYLSKFSRRFTTNPYSVADLISFLPFFIGLILWLWGYPEVFNIFRLCRVFRIFKVWKYDIFLRELYKAVKKNLYKYNIAFTLFFIVWLIWSFLIYSVENNTNPLFSNIPDAMRWAISTMATVWYWDIVPVTLLGKILSSGIIIFWPIFLSIITSVTIVTFLDVVRILQRGEKTHDIHICEFCQSEINKTSDNYCKMCGSIIYK